MARSGVDEFYEIIRLIIVKYYAELSGQQTLPNREDCDRLLRQHASEVAEILDGVVMMQSPSDLFPELQSIFGTVSIIRQDFTALDQAFEQLTSRSYKSDKGQYFTPRHVVDMCVGAVDPKPGETVCDPACGSAAFLKSAHAYGIKTYGEAASLHGFDFSHRACQVAKTVSLVGAAGGIQIAQVDSLRLKGSSLLDGPGTSIESLMGNKFMGFDVVITNPPFAGDLGTESFIDDYELASIYGGRLERDILFLERCIRLLKDGGRLAIVLPDNKVSGRTFRNLRLWLGRHALIKSVVSLHRYTFLPYTGQKAAVIFAVKRPPSMDAYSSEVLFFRSDKPGKTSNGSFIYRPGSDPTAPPYEALDHDLDEATGAIRRALCVA